MALRPEDALAIASSAERLGVDPRTLGALMELESGVNPNVWGGAGGKYRGLIQFGPGARKEVGLPDRQMTIAEQMPFVEKYMLGRGFKPGRHGPKELYRTVLVGNPGQSGTDSFGTNSDKAAQRMVPGGDLYERFSKKFGLPSAAQAQQGDAGIDLFAGLDAPSGQRMAMGPAFGGMGEALGPATFVGALAAGDPGARRQFAGSPSFMEAAARLLGQEDQPPAALPGMKPTQEATGGTISLKDLGQRLQGLGFKVAENPEFGGVGKHSPNSHHYSGDAFDLTIQPGSPLLQGKPDSAWRDLTGTYGEALRSAIPGAEVFNPRHDPVGGHDSHIHLGLPGASKSGVRLTPALQRLLNMAS